MSALVIAAPASGHGKTTVAIALNQLLKRRGVTVSPFKVGPDYIDTAFHTVAAGTACLTLDSFAMSDDELRGLAIARDRTAVIEGVMGLFDGGRGGSGSTASVAKALAAPVVLVIDVKGQAQSVAAVVEGFRAFDPGLNIAGVIFNRVGSQRHLDRLTEHLTVPLIAALPRNAAIELPSRHLGLVQARERHDLDAFCDLAADWLAAHLDSDALDGILERSPPVDASGLTPGFDPLGQTIAIARDDAFAFLYPHIVQKWRSMGAEVSFFSPLANEGPAADADAVFLPGGYPELHAEALASNTGFQAAMLAARDRGAWIYGECGGYMVLGEALIDKDGRSHGMLGLLPIETRFDMPKLHLGYRTIRAKFASPLGTHFRGHEFHYSRQGRDSPADPAFQAFDSDGIDLGNCGARVGKVFGSYLHLINQDPDFLSS